MVVNVYVLYGFLECGVIIIRLRELIQKKTSNPCNDSLTNVG